MYMLCPKEWTLQERPSYSAEKSGIRSHQDFESKTMTETKSVRRYRDVSRRICCNVLVGHGDESHLPVRREGPSIPHAFRYGMRDGETNQAPIIKPQVRPS